MSIRAVFYILLAVFLVLYGLFAVTNVRVEWGPALLGFAALAAGILAAVCAFRESR